MNQIVVAVHRKLEHSFSKAAVPNVELVPSHGVRGDAHFGVTAKHRSRVARDPTKPAIVLAYLTSFMLTTLPPGNTVSPGLRPGGQGPSQRESMTMCVFPASMVTLYALLKSPMAVPLVV